jgi:hypothetical protein
LNPINKEQIYENSSSSERDLSNFGPKGKLDQADQSYQDGDRQKYRHHISADAKGKHGIETTETAETKP